MSRLAVLVVLLTLGACGADGGSDEEPTETVDAFVAALSAGNGDEACSLLTEEARAPLDDPSDPAALGELFGAEGPIASCEDVISFFGEAAGAADVAGTFDVAATFDELEKSVEINGDEATATYEGELDFVVPFEKIGGDWLISDAESLLFGGELGFAFELRVAALAERQPVRLAIVRAALAQPDDVMSLDKVRGSAEVAAPARLGECVRSEAGLLGAGSTAGGDALAGSDRKRGSVSPRG